MHGDIKPGNIVVTPEGLATLADFGAAHRVGGAATLTPRRPAGYTPDYAAPEVVRGRPERASDVFSLAATLHHLVPGRPPRPDATAADADPYVLARRAARGEVELAADLGVLSEDQGPVSRRRADTVAPDRWPLDDDERLLLVVLGQRYLLYEEDPRPLSHSRGAEQLRYLRPEESWSERKVEYRIEAVRRRLHGTGFPHPLMHDTSAGRPSDDSLLHNLLKGLVESATLVPPDLDLVEQDGP
ncbi:hypothetical protein GCM10010341_54480 [Streptomyces noursei]|nr:hypothetical protein GCM10010341_54480 [Streptomyces noursei]